MSTSPCTRRITLALAATAAAVTLTACGGDSGSEGATAAGGDVDCSAFEQYGDLSGKSVSVYTSIVAPEDQSHIDSYAPFEECTGADIVYEARGSSRRSCSCACSPAARPTSRSSRSRA
ncbi:hypothetical protein [Kocuria sp. CNJ-770]|uniref:hypothetical protein n=1 Tax=Kocuria sp. CNJ-770 TaxID=1904964 RepID=UPI0026914DF6